mmetsp:Transcript_14417/g.16119  ORF Transcript_14417/g.16119 Transcript_14417/m.16119 type:complete len:121 (+) Transcript_14417:489-851(+)
MNGGTCYNGACLCPSGYGGKYCSGKGHFEDNTPSIWFILLTVFLVIVFMLLFGILLVRFINRQKEKYQQFTQESSEFGNDVFEDTGYVGESGGYNDATQEKRNPYHHRQFKNEFDVDNEI